MSEIQFCATHLTLSLILTSRRLPLSHVLDKRRWLPTRTGETVTGKPSALNAESPHIRRYKHPTFRCSKSLQMMMSSDQMTHRFLPRTTFTPSCLPTISTTSTTAATRHPTILILTSPPLQHHSLCVIATSHCLPKNDFSSTNVSLTSVTHLQDRQTARRSNISGKVLIISLMF